MAAHKDIQVAIIIQITCFHYSGGAWMLNEWMRGTKASRSIIFI